MTYSKIRIFLRRLRPLERRDTRTALDRLYDKQHELIASFQEDLGRHF